MEKELELVNKNFTEFTIKECKFRKTLNNYQNIKAVEALEKVKEIFSYAQYHRMLMINTYKLDKIVDNLIKEYGGKNE